MSSANFVKRFDDISDLAALGNACEALHAKGATWLRATPLPKISAQTYVIEGWRVRPDDNPLPPTAFTPDHGLDDSAH
jgi:hypothetical protein